MSNQWREEQNRCQREIERHQNAELHLGRMVKSGPHSGNRLIYLRKLQLPLPALKRARAPNRRELRFGWGARIRTWEWRYQKPLPYHLATPQRASIESSAAITHLTRVINMARAAPGGGPPASNPKESTDPNRIRRYGSRDRATVVPRHRRSICS